MEKEKHDPRRDLNPARRRDPPHPPPGREEQEEAGERVRPFQEEPPDPRDSGGIGG